MKITEKQYFAPGKPEDFSQEIRSNALQLVSATNILLDDFADWLLERDSVLRPQEATISSGIRTKASNKAIYEAINRRRIAAGLEPIPEATASSHLTGEGVDILDLHGLFQEYLLTDRAKAIYEKLNLYFEHFSATPTWVHCTTRKPPSGKRFFLP